MTQAATQTDWTETTLGEIAHVQTGPFGSQLHNRDYVKNGTPIITVEHIAEDRILHDDAIPKVSDEDKDRLSKYTLNEGDIVFSRVGSVDRSAYVSRNENGWMFSGRLLRVRAITDQVFPPYLHFALINQSTKEFIKKIAVGATMPSINTSILSEVPILLPPLPEQRAIAAVLSSLDDKIELLREQNKTLEDVAERLFQEWFGKYSVDDELPDGWKVGKFDDVTDIRGGTTPSTKNPNFWDGNLAWTSPKDLSNSKETFLLQTEKKITEEGLKQISSGLLPRGSLLLSSRAPIGYLAISDLEIAINQGYIAFLPNQYFSNYFMFLWLKLNMQEVINASNGSTFLEISKSSFRNIECVIPAEDILKSFDVIIQPFFQKILSNLHQIKTISTLRDTLLPRLMRGEVRTDKLSPVMS